MALFVGAAAARSDDTATADAPQAPPATPTGFAVAGTARTSITLSWNDTADETGYTIYRWNGSAYVALASVGANVVAYTDAVACNKTFYYKLSAFNGSGESAQTSENLAASSTSCFAADEYEPDNSAAQAVTLAPGAPQNHTIVPASDADWVAFTLSQTSGIVLTTAGSTGNTVLTLMNANGAPLMINDDYGNTFFSQISWTCAMGGAPAGTYYAKVESFNNAGMVGGYDLSLAVTDCADPTVSATPTEPATTPPSATAATGTPMTATPPSATAATATPSATATTSTATATVSPSATPTSGSPTASAATPSKTATITVSATPTSGSPTATATSGGPTVTSTATATAVPSATATSAATVTVVPATPTSRPGTPTATVTTRPTQRIYLPLLIRSQAGRAAAR